jgi:hypothetical protein
MVHRGRAKLAACLVAGLGLVSCGGDDVSYSNREIIDKLELTTAEDDNVYVLGNDAFCEVEKNLLNDADEVDSASDDRSALVISSREGNVGISAVPIFPPDCKDTVVKKLSRLDPVPEDG